MGIPDLLRFTEPGSDQETFRIPALGRLWSAPWWCHSSNAVLLSRVATPSAKQWPCLIRSLQSVAEDGQSRACSLSSCPILGGTGIQESGHSLSLSCGSLLGMDLGQAYLLGVPASPL